ncbi:mate-domain-containing protein [Gautieria morchelliformis]|nr:mate-domain-containing protein [Gautieria morchelliformis]
MSSTYVHYSSTSGSLPSDYGLLARYRQHNGDNNEDEENNENARINAHHADSHVTADTNFQAHGLLNTRRDTLAIGPPYHQPSEVKMRGDPSSWPANANREREPLLGQIPRINEDEIPTPNGTDGTELAIWWSEFWILSKYTWPVFGTHVLEYSLVVASVLSIGHISTTALAASTLGSMTASVTGFSIVQGFVSCLDTLLPGAWTSSHPELVGLWSQRMAVIMACMLIPISLIWLNAESVLLLLRQDPEVAKLAGIYLRWLTLGLPAYGFNNVCRRYFQSQGLFAVPTRIVMVIAPINALLNYLLVWGPMSIRLGYIGAPIATALSFNLMLLASILYGIYWTPSTAWHPFSRRSFKSLGVIVQLGLAGVGQTASEWWSWELIGCNSTSSILGPVSLAAQSVLLVSCSTSYQAPFALSVATSVRVGNLLGEENGKRAGIAARVSLLMTLGIAAILSGVFITFRHGWGYMFNDDPEVISFVASVLPLVALFQVFDGLGATTGGILRARGRQATLLNLSAYYMIGIPLGVYLAFKRDMKILGLWVGLTVALVYCAIVGVWLCVRADWDAEVQKVRNRVERERQLGKRLAGQIQQDVERS